jgi:hypothetical protein
VSAVGDDAAQGPVPGTEAVADRLAAVAEELADLALSRLQQAVGEGPDDSDGAALAADERRITRARRAVERALVALGVPSGG